MPSNGSRLTEREPVLIVTGIAAIAVALIQAAVPYLPDFGVPAKIITLITTVVGLFGAGAVARRQVVSPATWRSQTGRPVPKKVDLPPTAGNGFGPTAL